MGARLDLEIWLVRQILVAHENYMIELKIQRFYNAILKGPLRKSIFAEF